MLRIRKQHECSERKILKWSGINIKIRANHTLIGTILHRLELISLIILIGPSIELTFQLIKRKKS